MKRLSLPLLLSFLGFALLPFSAGAAAPPPAAKYLCLIVLDAGRPDYISLNLKNMPTVRGLLANARTYDRAWVGDLMSITPPGHAVIGSGSFPKDDGGLVNWDWGIHSTGKISPTLQAKQNYLNGYVFNLIKQSGTPTLSQLIRQKYPTGLAIAGSGAHFHAAGPMGGPYASWIFSYDRINGNWAPYSLGTHPVPSALLNDKSLRVPLAASNNSTLPLLYDPLPLGQQDSLVVSFAIKSLQLYRPRATMINLPEPDTAGHWSSNWYPEEARLYRSFDKDLARLVAAYKAAGIYNQTLFVITADHGMIQSAHRVLDRQGVRDVLHNGGFPTILVNGGGTGGPTMMSIWLRHQKDAGRAAQAIWSHNFDNVSAIFYQNASHGYHYRMTGCEQCSPALVKTYQYLLSTETGPTGEDVAILLRENARNSGLPSMKGRHGGADWGSQHITLIMSGPGVQPGISQHPARLADIAPTIEQFMGITPQARDGLVLADAFQKPVAGQVTAQNNSDQTLNVYVNALMQRAGSDIKLEQEGKLPNVITSDEVIIHWKRRLAFTAAGVLVLIITGVGLAIAIKEVHRQGTGLHWTA